MLKCRRNTSINIKTTYIYVDFDSQTVVTTEIDIPSSKSLENRLIILPVGIVSKKVIGLFSMIDRTRSCNVVDAEIVPCNHETLTLRSGRTNCIVLEILHGSIASDFSW